MGRDRPARPFHATPPPWLDAIVEAVLERASATETHRTDTAVHYHLSAMEVRGGTALVRADVLGISLGAFGFRIHDADTVVGSDASARSVVEVMGRPSVVETRFLLAVLADVAILSTPIDNRGARE